jgi:hypothetical protein
MSNDEIKKYLEDDIEKSILKEERRKAIEKSKKETRVANRNKLIEEAAKKLTKKEQKALGIYGRS